MKTYQEVILLKTFEERYNYLKLSDRNMFGSKRYLNQRLYTSLEWQRIRRRVIVRDNGCDLAHKDRPIAYEVYIHHIEPITYQDILEWNSKVYDLNNLICVSRDTHNAIHYGNEEILEKDYIPRTPNDTCPWMLAK